jgi:hypothetical protein
MLTSCTLLNWISFSYKSHCHCHCHCHWTLLILNFLSEAEAEAEAYWWQLLALGPTGTHGHIFVQCQDLRLFPFCWSSLLIFFYIYIGVHLLHLTPPEVTFFFFLPNISRVALYSLCTDNTVPLLRQEYHTKDKSTDPQPVLLVWCHCAWQKVCLSSRNLGSITQLFHCRCVYYLDTSDSVAQLFLHGANTPQFFSLMCEKLHTKK